MGDKTLMVAEVLENDYATFEKELQLPEPYLYETYICTELEHDAKNYDTYWYHPDHLGSSSYITNLDGNIHQHMEYLPFGETLVEEHLNSYNSPYKFNAKEFDVETGWYYYGARYYNPKWSIWLSVDPLAELYPSWSPYNYTLQNPINFIDPNGQIVEPARNQAGSIKQAVNQWRKAGLTTIAQIRNFVTNKNINGNGSAAVRYVYTKSNGWIDLAHYAGVQMYGKAAMDALEPASGNDIMQYFFFGEGANDSYYSYEDLPSNAFSAEVNLEDIEGEDLFDAIMEHFESAEATNPENAPNYEQIPYDDQDRSRLPEKNINEFDDFSPTRARSRSVPDTDQLRTGDYIPQNRTSEPYDLNNFDPANTSIEYNCG